MVAWKTVFSYLISSTCWTKYVFKTLIRDTEFPCTPIHSTTNPSLLFLHPSPSLLPPSPPLNPQDGKKMFTTFGWDQKSQSLKSTFSFQSNTPSSSSSSSPLSFLLPLFWNSRTARKCLQRLDETKNSSPSCAHLHSNATLPPHPSLLPPPPPPPQKKKGGAWQKNFVNETNPSTLWIIYTPSSWICRSAPFLGNKTSERTTKKGRHRRASFSIKISLHGLAVKTIAPSFLYNIPTPCDQVVCPISSVYIAAWDKNLST